jgi:regulator of protease activity HflC (stomatin/prohibitin superfamily)
MVFGVLTGLVLLGLTVAFIATVIHKANQGKKSVLGVILALICFIGFVIVPFSFHTVETGTVAVVKELGRAKEVRTSGTYFDLWLTNKYVTYDSKVQDVPITTAAYSKDAQTMAVAMNLQYEILPGKAVEIANQYGSLDALQARITAIATEKTKAVLSSHKAMDIIINRSDMSPQVEDAIRTAVGEEFYVNITSVVVTNIDFSDEFEKAVEDKMVAEQNKLKAEYDAQAKLVTAEAEAKANELLDRSITEEILQDKYLEKWDGKLPQVVAGDDMSMILPSIDTKTATK